MRFFFFFFFLKKKKKLKSLGIKCTSTGCEKCNCYTGQCEQCKPGYYGLNCQGKLFFWDPFFFFLDSKSNNLKF